MGRWSIVARVDGTGVEGRRGRFVRAVRIGPRNRGDGEELNKPAYGEKGGKGVERDRERVGMKPKS